MCSGAMTCWDMLGIWDAIFKNVLTITVITAEYNQDIVLQTRGKPMIGLSMEWIHVCPLVS